MFKPHISTLSLFLFTLVTTLSLLPPELLTLTPLPETSLNGVLGLRSDDNQGQEASMSVQMPAIFQNTARLPQTKSKFTTDVVTKEQILPFETQYQPTDELFIGESEVVQEGLAGNLVKEYTVYFWDGEEFDRELILSQRVEPIDQIIKQGTRKQFRVLETTNGPIEYWQIKRMWAMSYDGNCLGCSGRTILGTKVRQGACAVDPQVIPLGSEVYVPGYGVCRAEDVGGKIKGNTIDLGFEDLKSGWWQSRYVDVYFLR